MQTPFPPPIPSPSAPKKKWGLWLALGCGLPIGFIIVFIIAIAMMDTTPANKTKTTKTATATTSNLPRYAGKWQGTDGTSLWIRGDGKGDFNAGSTTVSGGGVTIDESAKTLSITSFFGIGKTWKIDQVPKSADSAQMTLDGIVYHRSGATDSTDSSEVGSTEAAALSAVPLSADCDKLARATLSEFDKCVAAHDFTHFYNSCSKAWQDQTTPAELKTAFQSFMSKGIRLDRTLRELKPVYDKPIVNETSFSPEGMLYLSGYYPTKPYRTYFKISYLKEGDTWRPASFHVKIGVPIK
ncbi:hypothetical protein IAD21_05992 [Abditibacteriota bacterium]|nr:hypothetical protein IAD21_05992 [Abditibacteriota bacterium]